MERENVFEFIPERNPEVLWEENSKGFVRIRVENCGLRSKIVKKLTGQARIDRVPLDRYGSFIWHYIDGEHTIGMIAALLAEAYPELEALEERMCDYVEALEEHGFIM